uniref:Protein kinase domain-containing protein n=1 Tax=Meloidogyne floridensis TaxID=298350 RepID=A0A915NHE2_9BILA
MYHAIHLDIKQSNFVVSLEQNHGNEIAIKLIDFGTSVLLDNAGSASLNILAQMHKAPEIRNDNRNRQGNITPKVDVWAFGIMSCQQLHGRVGRGIRQQFPAPRFIEAINYTNFDAFLERNCRNPNNNSNMDRIIKA